MHLQITQRKVIRHEGTQKFIMVACDINHLGALLGKT
jgi:hypothetical protein